MDLCVCVFVCVCVCVLQMLYMFYYISCPPRMCDWRQAKRFDVACGRAKHRPRRASLKFSSFAKMK